MTAYNFNQLLPDSSLPPAYLPGMRYSIDFEFTLSGTALVVNDTITTPAGALPSNGIRIIDTQLIQTKELDTNTTPTGALSVGDSTLSNRFISSVPMGLNGVTTAGTQLTNWINIPQGVTNGVVTSGYGYLYPAGTSPRLIVSVSNAVATGSTTGTIRLRCWFNCSGEQS